MSYAIRVGTWFYTDANYPWTSDPQKATVWTDRASPEAIVNFWDIGIRDPKTGKPKPGSGGGAVMGGIRVGEGDMVSDCQFIPYRLDWARPEIVEVAGGVHSWSETHFGHD